jgi:hypothetical protein
MDGLPQPDAIRQVVLETFYRLGIKPQQCVPLRETVLIRRGEYYGRSYRAGNLVATYCAQRQVLRFFNTSGVMLTAVSLADAADGRDAPSAAARRAA